MLYLYICIIILFIFCKRSLCQLKTFSKWPCSTSAKIWRQVLSVFAIKKSRKGIPGIAYHYITCPYVHTNMYCMYIQYVWYAYAAAHIGNETGYKCKEEQIYHNHLRLSNFLSLLHISLLPPSLSLLPLISHWLLAQSSLGR